MKPKRRRRRALATCVIGLAVIAFIFVFVVPRVLERMRYPIRYEAQIRAVSAERRVPPALLAAVALTESGYDASARSEQGALGLMQIMPETGGWIAEKLGEHAAFTQDKLLNADVSLSYGGWYLEYLLDRYDGDMICAIAAYHAGQGSVDKWISNAQTENDRALRIPDNAPRTRHYVSKVQNAYEYYIKVYTEDM